MGGNDQYTKLLIHSNTTNGDTSFVDSSVGGGHVITPNGSITHSTAHQHFGSTMILGDGSAKYLSLPASSDWVFTGEFNIDFWISWNAVPTGTELVLSTGPNGTYWDIMWDHVNSALYFRIGGVNRIGIPITIVQDQQYHIEYMRRGADDEIHGYLDGVRIGGVVYASTIGVSTNTLNILAFHSGILLANASIEEIRICNGIMYHPTNANFTPPIRYYDEYGDYTLQLPSPVDATTVDADEEFSTSYHPHFAVDTALSLTGAAASNSWESESGATTDDHRLNIELPAEKIIRLLYIDNLHDSGSDTTYGVDSFALYGSNVEAAFTETDPTVLSNLTLLHTDTVTEHPPYDTSDTNTFEIDNQEEYLYYVLLTTESHGGAITGIRRIELYSEDGFVPVGNGISGVVGSLVLSGDVEVFKGPEINGNLVLLGSVDIQPISNRVEGNIVLGGDVEMFSQKVVEVSGALFLSGQVEAIAQSTLELAGALVLSGTVSAYNYPVEVVGNMVLSGSVSMSRESDMEIVGTLVLSGGVTVITEGEPGYPGVPCELPSYDAGRWS